jgi:hypothetical protein
MLPMLTDDGERWEVGASKRTRGKAEFERVDVEPPILAWDEFEDLQAWRSPRKA